MSETTELAEAAPKRKPGRPKKNATPVGSRLPASAPLPPGPELQNPASDAGGATLPAPPAASEPGGRVILSVNAITDAMIQAGAAGPRDVVDFNELVGEVSMFDPTTPKTMKFNGQDVPTNPDAMPAEIWAQHKWKNYIQPVTRKPFSKLFGGPMPDELFDHTGLYTVRGIPVVLIPKPLLERESAAAQARMAEKTMSIFQTTPANQRADGGLLVTKASSEMVTPEQVDRMGHGR